MEHLPNTVIIPNHDVTKQPSSSCSCLPSTLQAFSKKGTHCRRSSLNSQTTAATESSDYSDYTSVLDAPVLVEQEGVAVASHIQEPKGFPVLASDSVPRHIRLPRDCSADRDRLGNAVGSRPSPVIPWTAKGTLRAW